MKETFQIRHKIKCCEKCVPPIRHIGCHADCETYIAEKEQLLAEKELIYKKKQIDAVAMDAIIKNKNWHKKR